MWSGTTSITGHQAAYYIHSFTSGKKISTLWQVYSSSFEVRLVYFKVTFQLVGPDCLFWSAWILTYIEVNFLTFSVGVSVFSNFYWQRTKC